MKMVSGVRSELKIRTIFNILGPLSNPSNAKHQVIGVLAKNAPDSKRYEKSWGYGRYGCLRD